MRYRVRVTKLGLTQNHPKILEKKNAGPPLKDALSKQQRLAITPIQHALLPTLGSPVFPLALRQTKEEATLNSILRKAWSEIKNRY